MEVDLAQEAAKVLDEIETIKCEKTGFEIFSKDRREELLEHLKKLKTYKLALPPGSGDAFECLQRQFINILIEYEAKIHICYSEEIDKAFKKIENL